MIFGQWLLLVVIGGLIGWFTNRLAIRLLFKPYEPIKMPLVGFELQGLIPRRKAELAHSVGIQIETELLSVEEIVRAFGSQAQKKELKLFLQRYLQKMVMEKIPSFLKEVMKKPVDHVIADMMEKESDKLLNDILEYLIEEGAANVKLAAMVEDKINAYPMEKLEHMVLAVAARELRQIEWIGGLLGMIIGFLQGGLLLLMG